MTMLSGMKISSHYVVVEDDDELDEVYSVDEDGDSSGRRSEIVRAARMRLVFMSSLATTRRLLAARQEANSMFFHQ